jgi:hypothetical protein
MQAATITSTNTVTFTSSKAGSFSITTAGTPVPSLSESGSQPSGVTFTDDNGDGTATLAGTPAAGTEKSYSLMITATSGAGQFTQLFTLVVVVPPASIEENGGTVRSESSPQWSVCRGSVATAVASHFFSDMSSHLCPLPSVFLNA